MKLEDVAARPKGILRIDVYRLGVLRETIEEKNLIVTGAFTAIAALVGGNVTNNSVTQIGFGTNGTAPVVGNTGLTGAFMKNVDSVSYPSAGVVQFNFSLLTTEDNGMAILEFGLFTAAGTLFSRLVRSAALNKASDISLSGNWQITF